MFATTLPYRQSHRHFSHAMAIHPLGLLRWEDNDNARRTIRATLALLDTVGPGEWCGYSYSWLGNMKARAKDGDGAARALSIARAFCTSNGFHVNGDQTSQATQPPYRPFTLEELHSRQGFRRCCAELPDRSALPAVPAHGRISQYTLRAEELSSARSVRAVRKATITAEKRGPPS
jgi:alpha-L-fucosidase 2